MTTTKVLFVCLGNICRSPLAEALFIKKSKKFKHTFEVDSAGTSDFHVGELPDPRTIQNALEHNLTLKHRARQFKKEDFIRFDHIITMDKSNLENVLKLAQNQEDKDKVKLLRDFDQSHPGADVPDPWFGGDEGFEEVYQIIDHCTQQLFEVLKKNI
ncbi:MAG: low molecular weight phosphotyrosine protein phosphatase [Bacteroidia bacterium]|nr:low molecular weight phosphotyrosine protein phosphatase [Bacteroidia bacterium]